MKVRSPYGENVRIAFLGDFKIEPNQNSNYYEANEVFWQSLRFRRSKRSHSVRCIEDQNLVILSIEKDVLGSLRGYFKDFKPGHSHTTEHSSGMFVGGKYYYCSKSTPRGQDTAGMNAAGCVEIQPEMLKGLNQIL